MAEAIGPRTYLVGRILSALLSEKQTPERREEVCREAVRLADVTLDKMGNR